MKKFYSCISLAALGFLILTFCAFYVGVIYGKDTQRQVYEDTYNSVTIIIDNKLIDVKLGQSELELIEVFRERLAKERYLTNG